MRKYLSFLCLLIGLFFFRAIPSVAAETPILALGVDLSDTQKSTVFSAMGITQEQAGAYPTIYITNEMEHQYLDESLGAQVVGKRSLSSVLLIPGEAGSGLSVETHNINYCTIAMYKNALLTAGVEDAKLIVAAPTSVSGTAALLGAVKAYEYYCGEEVSKESLEVATDELVLTGELTEELKEQLGSIDTEQVTNLIACLKQEIAKNRWNDPDKLAEIVRTVAEQMNLQLTDEQVSKIVDLLLKFSNLDIDAEKLVNQAKELYQKIDSLGIKIDTEEVGNFFTRLISSIWNLIQSFVKK